MSFIPPGLKAGKHRARVIEHCLFESEQKRTPGVRILFELAPYAGDGGDYVPVQTEIWLTPGAAKIARKSLRVLGFDLDSGHVKDLHERPTLLAGRECELEIGEEEYEGKKRLRVQWINDLKDPGAEGDGAGDGKTLYKKDAIKDKRKLDALSKDADAMLRSAKKEGKPNPAKRRPEDGPEPPVPPPAAEPARTEEKARGYLDS